MVLPMVPPWRLRKVMAFHSLAINVATTGPQVPWRKRKCVRSLTGTNAFCLFGGDLMRVRITDQADEHTFDDQLIRGHLDRFVVFVGR